MPAQRGRTVLHRPGLRSPADDTVLDVCETIRGAAVGGVTFDLARASLPPAGPASGRSPTAQDGNDRYCSDSASSPTSGPTRTVGEMRSPATVRNRLRARRRMLPL